MKPQPLFLFTAPCPVCKVEKELTKELAKHMRTHSVDDLEAAGVTVEYDEEAGE